MPSSSEHEYSIQTESDRIFRNVLLNDDRLQLPNGVKDVAGHTTFDAGALSEPFIPSPVKMTESSAALWALAATFANSICKERYGLEQGVVVNSDAASLF